MHPFNFLDGVIMKYVLRYKEIFYDRYTLGDDEKKHCAMYIIGKAFEEKGIGYTESGDVITLNNMDFEKEIAFEKIADILKREFFIFITKYEEPKPKKEITPIDECEKYIRIMCLDESFTISRACEHFDLTRDAFDKMFVKSRGITAKEYLKRIRVEKAKELVEAGEKMEEIAYLCGFGSVKTMQRAFKSVYGKTPGEYRSPCLDSKENE